METLRLLAADDEITRKGLCALGREQLTVTHFSSIPKIGDYL
jgi:hypothetical protein